MFTDGDLWIAKNDERICLLANMANRHGLITGATGTGKTITVKVLAETFSDTGVSVFLSDIKGDLTGMSVPGVDSEDMQKRIEYFGLNEAGFQYKGFPTTYWDVFSKKGTPVRTTISEMGPMLLSRLMNLSDAQEGVLDIVFKIADDQNLLILDLKDLRAMVQAVGDHAAEYKTAYGNITSATIGGIQRGLLKLEAQGADKFFGEPALDIMDWIRCDENGRGMVNVLNCEELFQNPDLYAAFLLWMLSELYERLPEVGDADKPKVVFFFDEAHLLFNIDSKELMSKVEQVVKLIRSKGVGVYFISQSPADIPNVVLSQLGNKIQHALRAYTPADQKSVKAAAQSFVVNPEFKTEEVITQLEKGEALVSFLNEKGAPSMVQRARILPPESKMGTIDPAIMADMIAASDMGLKYNTPVDRESAYEILVEKVQPDARMHQATQEYETAPENYAHVTPANWTCTCGSVNTANFCPICGAKKPETAKVQSNAGAAVPDLVDLVNSDAAAAQSQAQDKGVQDVQTGSPNLSELVKNDQSQGGDSQTTNLTQQMIEKKKQQKTEAGAASASLSKEEQTAKKKEEAQKKKEEAERKKAEARKEREQQRTKREVQKAAISVGRTATNTLVRGILKNLVK